MGLRMDEGRRGHTFGHDNGGDPVQKDYSSFSKVRPSQLVAIIGPVGSGKSSVLQVGWKEKIERETEACRQS